MAKISHREYERHSRITLPCDRTVRVSRTIAKRLCMPRKYFGHSSKPTSPISGFGVMQQNVLAPVFHVAMYNFYGITEYLGAGFTRLKTGNCCCHIFLTVGDQVRAERHGCGRELNPSTSFVDLIYRGVDIILEANKIVQEARQVRLLAFGPEGLETEHGS